MTVSTTTRWPSQLVFAGITVSLVSANGHKYPSSTFVPLSLQKVRLRGSSVTVAAAKKENNKRESNHSFVPKPDEATGPFPEAVLLKERKLEEDGQLLPEFADAEERELFEALNLQLESDLNVDQMRHYEVVYLIHEDHREEVEQVNMKVQEFLKEKKGKIWRFSDWGMRRLAYKIQKAKNAHYILMNFELEAKWINDFKSMLDKDERVIRHLLMKKDKAETEYCPPPPEFNTLRADMNDDEDDDEENDDEDLDDEGEVDIIYVDDDVNDGETSLEREKQKAYKVG
ncbi:Translation elongation factor EF1B/ribosomal protein S6 family protein [Abeliophyllum distichum]|uniref:Translation elongation factor EF1B/ribosomal protein S6 family protein n=1 Tax=Abeliophyllum distichum TaxID=126358 RepID=A0ABD1VBK8_9LAMI